MNYPVDPVAPSRDTIKIIIKISDRIKDYLPRSKENKVNQMSALFYNYELH